MKITIFSKIVNIYLFIMFLFFSLIVSNKDYANILEVRYYSFIFLTFSFFIILIVAYFYQLFINEKNFFSKYKLNLFQKLGLLYLLVNILATVFSPYKSYDLMTGLGRGEGLLLTSLYVLVYLAIITFGKFNKKMLTLISTSSIIICFICGLQFWGLNPFYMLKGIAGPYNVSYMGTIGNIAFLSAIITITLPVSICSYIFLKNSPLEKVIFLLSVFLSMFIMEVIDVDSGMVAVLFMFAVILPLVLKNNKIFANFLFALGILIASFFLNYFVNMTYFSDLAIYKANPQFNCLSLLILVSITLIIGISFLVKKKNFTVKNYTKLTIRIYISYVILGILLIVGLYLFDFNMRILSQVHNILRGNLDDNFGTYRIFLWKRSLILFTDYPILGTGPDTFALRFMPNYWQELIKLDGYLSINDTAANIYLTTLINIGIVGLISYILLISYPIIKYVKANNEYSLVLLIGVLCYTVQGFFNLSVIIVSPYFWMTLGILALSFEVLSNKEKERV